MPHANGRLRNVYQNKKRTHERARRRMLELMTALLRSGIIPIHSTAHATDAVRMLWLWKSLSSLRMRKELRVAILMLDWAARQPDHTAAIIDIAKRQRKVWHQSPGRFFGTYRNKIVHQRLPSHWKGRAASNLRIFVQKAKYCQCTQIASLLGQAKRVRVHQVLEKLKTMKGLGDYNAFAMLRSLSATMNINLKGGKKFAQQMSLHTSLLAQVLPISHARAALAKVCRKNVDDGFAAFIFCETCKIMRQEKVLRPLETYSECPDEFLADIAGPACRRLVKRAQDITDCSVSGNGETDALTTHVGRHRLPWHTSTDVLRRWKLSAHGRL